MLAVEVPYRNRGLGTDMIRRAITRMRDEFSCQEICLETEVHNVAALRLYERLGFWRDERMLRYYLNGSDAYRLKLFFHDDVATGKYFEDRRREEAYCGRRGEAAFGIERA